MLEALNQTVRSVAKAIDEVLRLLNDHAILSASHVVLVLRGK